MGNQWDATPTQMMINGLVFEHASEKYESYCGWPFKGPRKTIIDFTPTTDCFHPEGENTHTFSRQSCRAWVVIRKSRCTSFKTHTDTKEEGYAYFLICLTESNRGQVPPKRRRRPFPSNIPRLIVVYVCHQKNENMGYTATRSGSDLGFRDLRI